MKTFSGFDDQFDQNSVNPFIFFVLRPDLHGALVIIILDESRGIMDVGVINIATRLFPRLFFVVEFKSYNEIDFLVKVQSNKS
jgi:hypothetical protein